MFRNSVKDDDFKSVGWSNNILELQYHSGQIYQCYDVTQNEYNNFLKNQSLNYGFSELKKTHRWKRVS